MSNQETVHLLKGRKGFFRVVFSRAAIMALLVILEFLILLGSFVVFGQYFKVFSVLSGILSIAMVIYLFNCDMDSTPKLTWLILIVLFPVPISILLLFTRTDIGNRKVKKQINALTEESKQIIFQDESVINNKELINSGTDDLCKFLNKSGNFPIYGNTEVTYFPLGEKKFEALLLELEKAEKFIFIEYFIISEGYMWGSILKILAEKAAKGVDVRVMYDGLCELSLLTHDYPQRMAKLGIKCKPFTPITPFLTTQYNYRDHRKIIVIDGKVAFNGGVNLADEYINREVRFGHWKDTAVMLKGEAVPSFTLMFLKLWNATSDTVNWDEAKISYKGPAANGFVMPFSDCPLDEYKSGKTVYMDILNRAKHYVHIMTPYLILDGEMEGALKYAALRGVDVKLILPGIPDKKTAYALAKSQYRSLVNAGVKIYEYTPGFVHAKVFVSDNEKAVVGTINLDYRSLYHHFECATYMYKTDCIKDIEQDFHYTLKKCREVTLETIKKEKLFYKIGGGIFKFLGPLM